MASGKRPFHGDNATSTIAKILEAEPPSLERLGPDALQVDRRGRSVLDYPDLDLPEPDRAWYRMGTRQVWLDPAAPSVAEALAALTGELGPRYPEGTPQPGVGGRRPTTGCALAG